MNKILCLLLVVSIHPFLHADWNQWRGSHDGDGVIDANIPLEWSDTKNVIWKTPVPGRGYSQPIVVNGRIFVTTAIDEAGEQHLFCFDQQTGKQIWSKLVYKGDFLEPSHLKNSEASSTPVSDGSRVVVLFGINKSQRMAAYDFSGKQLWDIKVSNVDSVFGAGASPVLHDGRIFVLEDLRPDLFVAAYDISDGRRLWRTERGYEDANDKRPPHNYSTPRIFNINGQDVLVATGLRQLAAYNLTTGRVVWSIEGGTRTTVGSPLKLGDIMLANGGFPDKFTYAFDLMQEKELWEARIWTYISSAVPADGHLYGSANNGELACIEPKTGKILWREKLREDICSSLYFASGHVFVPLESGETVVVKPDTKRYIEVARNEIPGMTRSTPAFDGDLMYYRSNDALYCIGKQ